MKMQRFSSLFEKCGSMINKKVNTLLVCLAHSLLSFSKLFKISSIEDAVKMSSILSRCLAKVNSDFGFGQ